MSVFYNAGSLGGDLMAPSSNGSVLVTSTILSHKHFRLIQYPSLVFFFFSFSSGKLLYTLLFFLFFVVCKFNLVCSRVMFTYETMSVTVFFSSWYLCRHDSPDS